MHNGLFNGDGGHAPMPPLGYATGFVTEHRYSVRVVPLLTDLLCAAPEEIDDSQLLLRI